MLTESCPKVAHRFNCINCDYYTSRKSSYSKHLLTDKHIVSHVVNESKQKVAKSCNADLYMDMLLL